VTVLVVAVAAAAGALARLGVERTLPVSGDGTHYAGTLLVNLTGAFAAGLLMGALGDRLDDEPQLRNALFVGFLSSYTTFSALALQTIRLGERSSVATAALYLGATLAGGLLLAYAGLRAGRAL
jgi:CrcB protein